MPRPKPKPPNWKETCRAGLPPPYGWRYDHDHGALVEVQSEQITRSAILRMRRRKMTMRAIAKRLNDNGVPPPNSSVRWYHSHCQKILTVQRKRKLESKYGIVPPGAAQAIKTA